MSTLRVSEIFHSLQGESRSVGFPTVFIRLSGCPLRCRWCDTQYAFTGGERMPLESILDSVRDYGSRHVTVTGGEPLAQSECLSLLERLVEEGYEVSLETSGALDVSGVHPQVSTIMDLKVPSSGEESRNLYGNIEHLTVHDQIKFVIADEADYRWAREKLAEFDLAARCEVLFSPCAGLQEPVELAEKILRDRLPVRFQMQLHKLLWGNVPGK
jgi:7-carboxy-7-deazaguanine synthase